MGNFYRISKRNGNSFVTLGIFEYFDATTLLEQYKKAITDAEIVRYYALDNNGNLVYVGLMLVTQCYAYATMDIVKC